jgi:cytochrome c553
LIRSLSWLACLLACSAAAQPADRAAGKVKSAACAVCHGPQGLSMVPNAPHLASQPEIYLAEQLRNYRSGRRSHEVMSVIAKPLSDVDIDDLAAWYGGMKIEVRE